MGQPRTERKLAAILATDASALVFDAMGVMLAIDRRHVRRDEQFLPNAFALFAGAKDER
jgi:hypothetical protein